MKLHHSKIIFLGAILSIVNQIVCMQTLHADCSSELVLENHRDPIPYQPFPMVNPESGELYHPNDLIEFESSSGGEPTRVRASEFFAELNETEKFLNQWGYTLRSSGADTLSQINHCAGELKKQAKAAEKQYYKDNPQPTFSEEEWRKQILKAAEDYVDGIPTMQELWQKAEDEDFDPYLPEVPVFTAPVPQPKVMEVEFTKEKNKNFELGESGKFYTELEAFYKVQGNKIEVSGTAGAKLYAGLIGLDPRQVASAEISGKSPGTEKLSLKMKVEVAGQTVYNKTLLDEAELSWGDEYGQGVHKKTSYRFAIGPIPMKAELGFRGDVRFRWNLTLRALQILANTGPYASVDAYAQVGADAEIVAIGVGGLLTLARFHMNLYGSGAFNWVDEPKFHLNIGAKANLTLLSGELYGYARYKVPRLGLPPWKDKESRHVFYSWPGIVKEGTLFEYTGEYTRNGLVASGELSPEDVEEQKFETRKARLTHLENRAAKESYEVLVAVTEGLSREPMRQIKNETRRLDAIADDIHNILENYRQDIIALGEQLGEG